MALVVGTNSYISVANADLYFADRYYSYTYLWGDVSADNKPLVLVSATGIIDSIFIFYGEKNDSSQALEFPRYSEDIETPSIPTKVEQATCELALYIFNYGTDFLIVPDSVKLDKIRVDLKGGEIFIPEVIRTLLKEYGYVIDKSKAIQTPLLVR